MCLPIDVKTKSTDNQLWYHMGIIATLANMVVSFVIIGPPENFTPHLASIFSSYISHIVPPGLVLSHGSSCGTTCHTHYGLHPAKNINQQTTRQKEFWTWLYFIANFSKIIHFLNNILYLWYTRHTSQNSKVSFEQWSQHLNQYWGIIQNISKQSVNMKISYFNHCLKWYYVSLKSFRYACSLFFAVGL